MSILRRTYQPLLSLGHHLRPLSAAAVDPAVGAVPNPSDRASFYDPLAPLDYLPGFPRPDPKYNEKILAIPRADSGKYIAARERKAGRVPSIVFEQENGHEGGNKRLISVEAKQIRKLVDHLGRSFFLSRLFELEVWSEFGGTGELIEKVRVLPRLVS